MRLVYTKSAEKELLSVEKSLAKRIFKKTSILIENPQPHGSQKIKDGYRIRIGKYRVIYTIDKINKLITITKVGHRKEVYR